MDRLAINGNWERGMYMAAMVVELRGDLSHKHAAVLAGLGEIGVNTLLINPEFGNRLMLSSIVTNATLVHDKPFSDQSGREYEA